MSKIHATEEGTGRRFLLRIECDALGCVAMIKPHPEIAKSGWVWRGQDSGPGTEQLRWDYCPEHAVCARGGLK